MTSRFNLFFLSQFVSNKDQSLCHRQHASFLPAAKATENKNEAVKPNHRMETTQTDASK